MKDNFRKAKRILRTGHSSLHVVAVNGCCYGRDSRPDKGEYFKYCGQQFWEFISDNDTLYQDIIEPLGYKAKEKNEAFQRAYARILNKFTLEFSKEFCDDGIINWEKLVAYNSSSTA